MTFRSTRSQIILALLLAFLLSSFPAQAKADGVDLPSLEEFVGQIQNGEGDTPRGIYIPDILASPILSQPQDDPGYVFSDENTLTQFAAAARAGSIGLLAHNYLAGSDFFKVKERQLFYLVYGDGRTETFIVTDILRYQALDPDNVWSKFIDLQRGDTVSASTLFSKVYARPGHIILQTCISVAGDASWGRLFIVAEPYSADDHGERIASLSVR